MSESKMDLAPWKDRILELLAVHGPMTGKQLVEQSGLDAFIVWKTCNSCDRMKQAIIGKRYLRLDRRVEGYARLSPSILREFLGYTVVGRLEDWPAIRDKADLIHQDIIRISKDKFELAKHVVEKVVENQPDPATVRTCACFMIAGDVAYGMAHLEPRPESSTGKMVNGSDLDIVVITKDLPSPLLHSLDTAVYNQKYMLLKNPMYHEEIDYVIKDLSRVVEQLKFDRFESMVAVKILHEALFLGGNRVLFDQVKQLLVEQGIHDKMTHLEQEAIIRRQEKWASLIQLDRKPTEEENLKLFYTMEEIEEFF